MVVFAPMIYFNYEGPYLSMPWFIVILNISQKTFIIQQTMCFGEAVVILFPYHFRKVGGPPQGPRGDHIKLTCHIHGYKGLGLHKPILVH